MPSVESNLRLWDVEYAWHEAGDEWSVNWGGAAMQWFRTLLPRIQAFVPAGTILELGPGYGRWSARLKDLCEHLILVDLSETCIDACKSRFADSTHISYHVNDGRSLDMVPDGSADFVFSFDSLVHAEADVMEAYAAELARKLSDDAAAFIHHSNLAQYDHYVRVQRAAPGPARKVLKRLRIVEDLEYQWRARTMSAEAMARFAEAAGLRCVGQEKVNWNSRRPIDCMSILTRKGSRWDRPNRVLENRRFMAEAAEAKRLGQLYGARGPADAPAAGTPGA
jgi:SAM-dependent methyltransferase